VLGTPVYMPPEQVEASPDAVGPACDVYSLGVILYELLTGRVPFQGAVPAILAQILTKEPPPPSALCPGLDLALERIIQKAMSKKPKDRFASMGAFAAALTNYLKTSQPAPVELTATRSWHPAKEPALLEATVAPAGVNPGPPRRRLALAWLLLATVLLLLVGIGTVAFLAKPRDNAEPVLNGANGPHAGAPPGKGTDKGNPGTIAKNGQPGPDEPPKGAVPRAPNYTNAPELNGADLPIAVSWDTRGFHAYVHILRASFDPEKNQVTWLGEAKRGFAYVPSETMLDVDFFDAEDVRLTRFSHRTTAGIRYTPEQGVKAGEKIQIVLTLPRREILHQTVRVALRDRNQDSAAPPPVANQIPSGEEAPEKEPAWVNTPEMKGLALPFQAAWDTRLLRTFFHVVKAAYDPEKKEIAWLLEAKRGFVNEIWAETKVDVHFHDADAVRIHLLPHRTTGGLGYLPDKDVKAGDRVRITLRLPDQNVLARTATVVLVDPTAADPKGK
jgi:hypothetical protein